MADRSWDKLNYNRFDHIEDSSESEGDCHPNIDLGSWKRMKKRMRDEKGLPPRGAELHDAYTTTKINRAEKTEEQKMTDEQIQTFFVNNKKHLDQFSIIPDDEKALEFLTKHPEVVTSNGEGYLITKAVDTSCEGEPASLMVPLMAKRCLLVHNIIASAKDSNMKADVALKFFAERQKDKRIKEIYEKEFTKQHDELLELIRKRTKERKKEEEEEAKRKAAQEAKIQEMTAEEAEANKAPLGPGGLDPTEVLNTLPKEMQDAFMSKDIEKLKEVIAALPEEEAATHMERCVKSGLWVPGE